MAAPVIAVREVTKTYGPRPVVDGLSFEVTPGTVTAFLGPNGAGKTTTIRVVLGLTHPDDGEATVFGRPFTALDAPMSRVGVLIDGAGFHPLRSARAHLRMLAAAGAVPTRRVGEVLELVELTDAADRKVGGFSLGMRQRLGLASALLGSPDLLILDEPANGLDPAGIRWLRSFLTDFASAGRTALVSSHVLSEVALLAHEVIVINHGRLIEQTAVDRLTSETAVTVRTPQLERLRPALLAHGAAVRPDGDHGMEVTGLPVERVGELAAEAHVVLHQLTTRTQTLEDVFLDLTTEDTDDATAAQE